MNYRGDLPSDVLALSYGLPTRFRHKNTTNRSPRRPAPAPPPSYAALGARGRQEPQRYVPAAFARCPTLPYPTLLYSTRPQRRCVPPPPRSWAQPRGPTRPRAGEAPGAIAPATGFFLKPLRGSSAPKHPWAVAPIFFRPRVAFFLLPERPCPALPCPGVGGEHLPYPGLLPTPEIGRAHV